MRRLVQQASIPYDVLGQIPNVNSIESWVRDRLVYTVDYPVEILRSPDNMLATIRRTGYFNGDCDDATILASALVNAMRYPVRFVAITDNIWDEGYSHVYCQYYFNNAWRDIDATEPEGTIIVYPSAMLVTV